ncbi:hypothetical protein JZ751_012533, partial [Albula glossodonta]
MGFYGTLKMIFYKMKRKLDHGPEVRSFPSGKKPCKGPEYPRHKRSTFILPLSERNSLEYQLWSPQPSVAMGDQDVPLGCTRVLSVLLLASPGRRLRRRSLSPLRDRCFIPDSGRGLAGHAARPAGLVPYPATPTTFGDLRAANGQGQQRRRITSIQPPAGLQEWLRTFQSWSGPEKLLALDELIDSCEPTQVKHMMQVIEPQFQRDFISLLPKELALYVLSFLEPKDLLQAAQTCRYWRNLAEDNLLWREKCREEGIDEPLPPKRRKVLKPGFTHSPWKSAYIRQHRIDTNWRRGDLKSPKVLKGHDDHVITCLQFCGNRIVSGSDDNTLKVWSAVTGKRVSELGCGLQEEAAMASRFLTEQPVHRGHTLRVVLTSLLEQNTLPEGLPRPLCIHAVQSADQRQQHGPEPATITMTPRRLASEVTPT